MNPAETFCAQLYAVHSGRVPLFVGMQRPFRKVYPLVFQNHEGMPLGLVGCAWNEGMDPDLAQLYHISAFQPGSGAGSEIMSALCALADELQVRITTQPELIGVGVPGWAVPDDGEAALRRWYTRFGFTRIAGVHLERSPKLTPPTA
ncbi:hypothetical protein [Stenotrophomonas sp. CASM110]|uniref:hypothetical protein n=1 Tax=Stenotrophomonas sp. CASM110 TaxID=3111510 RepID=UPI003BF7801E